MMQQRVLVRPPLGPAVRGILIANAVVFLGVIIFGYATDFGDHALGVLLDWLALTPRAVTGGRVWQAFTYMWLHDPASVFHIIFNLIMLYVFGTMLEQRWGTRRFFKRYLIFGLGGAVAGLLSAFVLSALFNLPRLPALGASGAVAGLAASFAFLHWRTEMQFLFGFRLTGKGLLVVLIAIDLLSLLMRSGIAVEAHWGGMLTAYLMFNRGTFDPRTLRLRLRRWRLKRRLRLEPGGRSGVQDPDAGPYLH